MLKMPCETETSRKKGISWQDIIHDIPSCSTNKSSLLVTDKFSLPPHQKCRQMLHSWQVKTVEIW